MSHQNRCFSLPSCLSRSPFRSNWDCIVKLGSESFKTEKRRAKSRTGERMGPRKPNFGYNFWSQNFTLKWKLLKWSDMKATFNFRSHLTRLGAKRRNIHKHRRKLHKLVIKRDNQTFVERSWSETLLHKVHECVCVCVHHFMCLFWHPNRKQRSSTFYMENALLVC